MRLDQRLLHLNLHAGSTDGGVSRLDLRGPDHAAEIHLVVAAFNGGFKLTYANVGFMSGGHVAVPLSPGSRRSSPTPTAPPTSARGTAASRAPKTVFSVLQNQHLLVDRGVVAPNVAELHHPVLGRDVEGRTAVARSGIGITASGELVWAAGEDLMPASSPIALVAAGAVRAIELDINPDWVAGYLYVHPAGGPSAVPVVPGQLGIAGKLLEPYSRDFLTIVAD